MKLVGGGSVINGAYPLKFIFFCSLSLSVSVLYNNNRGQKLGHNNFLQRNVKNIRKKKQIKIMIFN